VPKTNPCVSPRFDRNQIGIPIRHIGAHPGVAPFGHRLCATPMNVCRGRVSAASFAKMSVIDPAIGETELFLGIVDLATAASA